MTTRALKSHKDKEQAENARYGDPQATIVLKSKEGVLFRVNEYMARRSCGFFEDIATLPGLTAEPIEIDASTVAIRHFLDAVYTHDMGPTIRLTLGTRLNQLGIPLWDIAEFLQAPAIQQEVIRCLRESCFLWRTSKSDGAHPAWVAFALSARKEDLKQAREALKELKFAGSGELDGGAKFNYTWREEPFRSMISASYAAELSRLLSAHAYRMRPSSALYDHMFVSLRNTLQAHRKLDALQARPKKRRALDDESAERLYETEQSCNDSGLKESIDEILVKTMDWEKVAEAFTPDSSNVPEKPEEDTCVIQYMKDSREYSKRHRP